MSAAPRRLPAAHAYALPTEAELPRSRATFRLDARRAALLVHDMQAYFVDVFAAGDEPIAPVVANVARLAARFRALGLPVIYTAQEGEQDPRDRGLQADLWGPGMRRLPEHQRIVDAIGPASGDVVIVKHRYSAFQRSNLEHLLRARGLDQLVVSGVYAHIGCQLTAAEAFQRDVQPFFVADAVADFSRPWHDQALAHVADCCGVVVSTRQVLAAVASEPPRDPS